MQPLVSVLILNFRNANATVRCVKALQEQTLISQIEILVIDNHSDDDSIGILRTQLQRYRNVRFIETPSNDGFGSGYNMGVSYAVGEFVLVNNPDKVLEPDGIEKMVTHLQKNDEAGIVAPRLIHSDGTQRLSIRRYPHISDIVSRRSFFGNMFPSYLDGYLMKDTNLDEEQEVDWAIGGCFMMSRDLFQTLGGFDERFFLFFEDTDLCRRCHEVGKKVIYLPSVRASDRKNRLSGENFWDLLFKKTGRIHVSSAFKYFWKWKGKHS
jgi:N-acetylglucosaminyl-diphospho-decaprenol L-rhamnosyltransferase